MHLDSFATLELGLRLRLLRGLAPTLQTASNPERSLILSSLPALCQSSTDPHGTAGENGQRESMRALHLCPATNDAADLTGPRERLYLLAAPGEEGALVQTAAWTGLRAHLMQHSAWQQESDSGEQQEPRPGLNEPLRQALLGLLQLLPSLPGTLPGVWRLPAALLPSCFAASGLRQTVWNASRFKLEAASRVGCCWIKMSLGKLMADVHLQVTR
jgi:hypothetical protein